MTSHPHGPVISLMLAVPDATAAARWYERALGATKLWDLGGVVGLTADGGFDPIRDHRMPWGTHRQGGFLDPFGHLWLVGDRSPLRAHDPR
jgi:PhnB protein